MYVHVFVIAKLSRKICDSNSESFVEYVESYEILLLVCKKCEIRVWDDYMYILQTIEETERQPNCKEKLMDKYLLGVRCSWFIVTWDAENRKYKMHKFTQVQTGKRPYGEKKTTFFSFSM